MRARTRLTTPLVRRDGELRAASWEEALDCAAAGLERARTADATRSFGMFAFEVDERGSRNFLGAASRACR